MFRFAFFFLFSSMSLFSLYMRIGVFLVFDFLALCVIWVFRDC